MTARHGAPWLPSALFLLQVSGCLSLRGPSHVMGPVGGSLSVQCRYNEEFTENKKYWYKGSYSPLVKKIVETTESQREVRRGRVSIRDHPANHTFTVTLESLTEDDEGTYVCGIYLPWHEGGWDPTWKVVVTVIPAPNHLKNSTSTLGPLSSLPTTTWTSMTGQKTSDLCHHPRSLLSSIHFLLLVFLKLPLLLSMLGAVLWVNRPQRSSGGRRSALSYENQ
ncbi:CMRF35-like molecule 6 isoform X1 [Saccopteryx bilineata]|uniref:CMRF35-like molecule 6 isoform X1 n=1 Tax=Saccopteryx bilineata TaxID=59482 RepID=UPI00338F1BD4